MSDHTARDYLRETAMFIMAELDADELAPDEIHAVAMEGLQELERDAGWLPRPNLRGLIAQPWLTMWMCEGRN